MECRLMSPGWSLMHRGSRSLLLVQNASITKRPRSQSPTALFVRSYAPSPLSRHSAGREHKYENQYSAKNPNRNQNQSGDNQAYPLSGYYYDILTAHSPYRSHSDRSRPQRPRWIPDQPEDQMMQGEGDTARPESPQDKMSIVFGTRLASPGRSSRYKSTTPPESKWKTINGVAVPPQPEEPDNCCMSGCAHCVWDDFRDEMEGWANKVEQARANTPHTKMRHAQRAEVASASASMDDDGGGSETNFPEVKEDIFSNIPVGIREFMKTEKKLKQRH